MCFSSLVTKAPVPLCNFPYILLKVPVILGNPAAISVPGVVSDGLTFHRVLPVDSCSQVPIVKIDAGRVAPTVMYTDPTGYTASSTDDLRAAFLLIRDIKLPF